MKNLRKKLSELSKNMAVKYAAIAALPILVLLWVPVVNFTALYAGESVLLETLPVDPTDFLRGDYVTLRYKIENAPDELMPDMGDYSRSKNRWPGDGDGRRPPVYVALEKDPDGVGHVEDVTTERPGGGLYLKGKINRYSTIQYDGINAYYVPEGTGREIERRINDSNVLVDLRVLRGHAVINGLVFAERDEDEAQNDEEDE
jgi:uncharacterized membrane-anchored protein